MKEKREGGSVPGFIIGAIILVGLLVCGAYFVQQQSRNKPVTAPTPITELPGGDQKPADEPTPPPAVPVPQPSPNNSTTQSSPQANRLPQSGPADGVMAILAISLLVGATASYVQSRRQLAPL
jgi:hypothetical protein